MEFDGREEREPTSPPCLYQKLEEGRNYHPFDGWKDQWSARRWEHWNWRYKDIPNHNRQAFADQEDTARGRKLTAVGLPHDQPTWNEGIPSAFEGSVTEEDMRQEILRRLDKAVKIRNSKFSALPRLRRKGV